MDIPAYVLVTKDGDGRLHLGLDRNGGGDLPIGFESSYAYFLFQFGESRIKCQQDDEILLLKGVIETADLQEQDNYVDVFKQRVRETRDYSTWQVVQSKRAMCESDGLYRQQLMSHLEEKYTDYRLDRMTRD